MHTMSALHVLASFHNTDLLNVLLRPLALMDMSVTAMGVSKMRAV